MYVHLKYVWSPFSLKHFGLIRISKSPQHTLHSRLLWNLRCHTYMTHEMKVPPLSQCRNVHELCPLTLLCNPPPHGVFIDAANASTGFRPFIGFGGCDLGQAATRPPISELPGTSWTSCSNSAATRQLPGKIETKTSGKRNSRMGTAAQEIRSIG